MLGSILEIQLIKMKVLRGSIFTWGLELGPVLSFLGSLSSSLSIWVSAFRTTLFLPGIFLPTGELPSTSYTSGFWVSTSTASRSTKLATG